MIRQLLFLLMMSCMLLVVGCTKYETWHKSAQVKPGSVIKPIKQVKLAILDSGVETAHAQLENVEAAFNTITKTSDTNDKFNHGTKIAGVIGDREFGLNPHVKLYDIQVLNERGQGSWQQICAGIDKAIEFDVDIINMSLGFNYDPPGFKACIDRAIANDIIVVASAGDNASERVNFPARYPNVISVSAISEEGSFYKFASSGKIDYVAPGVDIPTRSVDGKMELESGSSLAAANFSSVLAMHLGKGMKKDEIFNKKNHKMIDIEGERWKMLTF